MEMHKFPRLKGWFYKCNKDSKRAQSLSSLPSYLLKQLQSHWGPCRKILWWRKKQLLLGAPLQSLLWPKNQRGRRGRLWMKWTNSNKIKIYILKAQESKLQFSRLLVQWPDKSLGVWFWLLWDFTLQEGWIRLLIFGALAKCASVAGFFWSQ